MLDGRAVTVIISGDRVVALMTVEGVAMLVVVMSSVYTEVVVTVAEVVHSVPADVTKVGEGYWEYEGAGVDSGIEPEGLVDRGGKGVAVTVITMVEGVSNAVTTIVDNNVDSCVSVTGGRVSDSITVVATGVVVEPPSTGTTEYVTGFRGIGRLLRGPGLNGRASARAVMARRARRLEDVGLMMWARRED